jgi:serine/threonine-protein kinase
MGRKILQLILLFCVFFAIAGASAYLTLTFVIESEETVVVPRLKGEDAIAVLELLSELGLNTKVRGSEFNADVPKHHVIYQEPAAGTRIKKGRDVKVVLSKGPQTLPAPNLEGVSLQQAEVILKNNGLSTGVITETYHPGTKRSMVIAQDPGPGQPLERRDAVSLLISLGPRYEGHMMPRLEGLGLEKALAVLENRELAVGRIDSDFQEHQPPNIVIEQKPPHGYYVEPDRAVDLTVNRWSPDKRDTSAYSPEKRVLFRHQVPPGILKQHIRLELHAFGMSSVLYDQLMKPGREIWIMIPRYTDAAVFLYQNGELIRTEVYR